MWLSDISVRRPLVAVVLSALLTVFGLVWRRPPGRQS